MRINKLIIHGFGKFVEREFAFGSGLNVVLGDNEAGKSTLMKAIMAAFFGLRTSDSSRWKPWSDYQDFSLTTEFVTSEGQRLRLRRDLATHQAVVEDISSEMSGFYADGISRKRQQDFAGREPTLIFKGDANPGGRTPEKARYDELLRSWLGLADEELFRHSVYVGQNELVALGKQDIVERLKSLISGPELASYQVVLSALERRLDELRRLPGKRKERKIEALSRELQKDRERHLRSLEKVQSLKEQENEKENLVRELRDSEKEQKFLARMVEAINALEEGAKEAEETRKALSEKRREKERIEKIQEDIDNLTGQIREYQVYGKLPPHLPDLLQDYSRKRARAQWDREKEAGEKARLAEIEERVSNIERELSTYTSLAALPQDFEIQFQNHRIQKEFLDAQRERLQHDRENLSREVVSMGPSSPLLPLTFSVLLLLLFVILGILVHPMFLAGTILAPVPAAIWYIKKFQGKEMERSQMLTKMEEQLRAIEESLQEREDWLRGYLDLTSCADNDDLATRLEKYRKLQEDLQMQKRLKDSLEKSIDYSGVEQLKQQIEEMEQELKGYLELTGAANLEELIHGFETHRDLQEKLQAQKKFLAQLPDMESVEEEIDNLTNRLLVLDRKMEEWAKQAPEITNMSAAEKFRMRDNLGQLEKKIQSDRERLIHLRGAISGFRWDETHPDQLKEEIEEKERTLGRLELEADGLARAIVILGESSQEFRAEIAPYLEEQAGEVFRRVTRGKYSSLSFDPESLEASLLHEGRLIQKDSLSTGTQEQLYLAIRIALSQLISGERKLPFFFDDSLLNFDEGRKKEALEVLKEMASEHQIFLFTIDGSLKNVDAHVVEI